MRRIAILMLLLAACQYYPLPGKGPAELPQIYTGTSALEASFNPASTNSILMCQQADVFVDMKNLGAFDISNGFYSFIGEGQYLQPIGDKQKTFSLEGKSQFNPRGGFDQVRFRMKSVGLPAQLESYEASLIFQACYKYKTTSSAQVCIDPDIANLNPRKSCRVEPVTMSNGQGAPVAVVKVEPKMVPEGDQIKPMFVIYVQHLGTGSVVSQDVVELACKGGASKLTSFAGLKAFLHNQELKCGPEGKAVIRVEGVETRIICESSRLYDIAGGTFSTILSVELDYGYVNRINLPIAITRLPSQGPCK